MKVLPAAGLFLLLYACRSGEETTRPVVENITESVYASGIVKSRNQYQVFSPVNGLIRDILVTEGAEVRQGDPLMILVNEVQRINAENARLAADYASVPNNRNRLTQLEADIGVARTQMIHDSLLYLRQRNLWQQDIGSRNELERRELAYRSSATSYENARLQLKELKRQISFSEHQAQKNLQASRVLAGDYVVRARQNGRVYSLVKETGEMVSSQSPLAVIGDARSFYLELQVDEFDISLIRTGQRLFVTMDSYKGSVFEALVSRIDPIMNDRSRSFKIEADFIGQPGGLYPNLTAEANILIRAKEHALTIPRNYLLNDSLVVLKNGERKKVSTGLKDYRKVEILSGIDKETVLKKPAE